MSVFGRGAYRLFVLLLGLWTGAGLHDSLSSHFAWYADPIVWADRPVLPGMVNAWPFTTMALLLATIVAGVAVWRYRGPGRRHAALALGGTALIIAATLGYFVPMLGAMFGEGSTMTDAQLVAASHSWIVLNAVRQLILLVLFWYALVALGRLASPRGEPVERRVE